MHQLLEREEIDKVVSEREPARLVAP